MTLDLNYEYGFQQLEAKVAQLDPTLLAEVGTLKSRLLRLLADEERYGSYAGQSHPELARVIDELGRISLQYCNIHFIDLCRFVDEKSVFTSRKDTASQPLKRPQRIPYLEAQWRAGSEIEVEGTIYVLQSPIERLFSADGSVTQECARALPVGSNRITWLKRVVVHKDASSAAYWKGSLEKEARLLEALEQDQQSNFPRCLVFKQLAQGALLVQHMARGKTLTQVFGQPNNPLDSHNAYILIQSVSSLCGMLRALHKKRLAHRNLTPECIFLHHQRAYLRDVGLATHRYEPGEGPDRYRAPEQMRGNLARSMPGPQTDMYQVGAILYHFLTGKLPDVTGQLFPPSLYNSTLPSELDEVLLKALALKPGERWRTIIDFARVLKKCL